MKPLVPLCSAVLVACSAGGGDVIPLGTAYEVEGRAVNVWAPKGDARGAQGYTTLYLLDGGVDQDFPHIAGLAQLGELSWTFEPLIVVGIASDDRRAEFTWPAKDARHGREFPTHGAGRATLDFITQEVRPFVEARYPTNGRTAVMGESLAGLFVTEAFLRAPESFDDYVAISPSLWWDRAAPGRQAAERLAAHPAGERRLFLSIADEDGAMQQGMDALVGALWDGAPEGLEWSYADFSGEQTHATTYHPAALMAFHELYAEEPYAAGDTPWFMEPVDE